MVFSRIQIRPDARNSKRFWTAFRDPYSLHKAVWELFGDHRDRKRDFLYHLKEGEGSPVVYALSDRAPRGDSELWQVDEPKPFSPRLRDGMRLGFLLRANPVTSRKPEPPDPNPKKRKRHDVVMEEKCKLRAADTPKAAWPTTAELVQTAGARWLGARSERAGFRLATVRADGYRQHRFRKGRGRPVQVSTIDFSGVLEVLDPGVFLDQLHNGLGPSKGFGCGLMLIRRV
jgi:CRISPR system Cascade subunit CasE